MSTRFGIHSLALAAAVFLAYLNAFHAAFQYDDYKVIVGNPAVHTLPAWLADLKAGGIRPLLKLSYTLNWITGAGVTGFHLLNITVHAINAILVFALSRRLIENWKGGGPSHAGKTAFIVALLFALHPAQTESVTYICGRSTSFMTTFYLASLLAYDLSFASRRGFVLRLASAAFFAAAVAVKEVALTLPAALALWESARRGTSGSGLADALRRQAWHWAVAAVLAAVMLGHSGYPGLLAFSLEVRTLSTNLMSQIHGVTYLLSRLVLIDRLNFDPDLPVIGVWNRALTIESVFLSALLVAGIMGYRCGRVWIGFAVLWFFLHLLPTNSILPRLDVANERQLYLSGWGIFLAVGIELDRLRGIPDRYPKQVRAGIILVLLALGAFTLARNRAYRDETALWEDTVRKSPGKARAYNNLGYAYFFERRYEDSIQAYETALRLKPAYPLARDNLLAAQMAAANSAASAGESRAAPNPPT